MKDNLYIILLSLLSIVYCKGQASDYIYTNFTVSNGLPSNECHAIIQDSHGYIWIGTDNGVARYDGYEFKHYSKKEGLDDNVIFKLFEDKEGKIWAGGLKHMLFIYDPATDLFSEYEYNSKIVQNPLFISTLINDFAVEEGKLFCPIDGTGIIEIDKQGNTKNHYLCDQSKILVFQDISNPLLSIGCMYSESSALKLEYSNNTIACEDNQTSKKLSVDIISGQYSGIIRNKNSFLIFTNQLLIESNDSDIRWHKSDPNINKIQKDHQGNIVISYDDDLGCKLFRDIKKNEFEYLIKDVSVTNFMEDRDGGYWLATIDKGLFHIKNKHIKYISSNHTNKYYTHIDQDKKGNLYTASFDGALEKVNISNKNIDVINYEKGFDYQAMKYDNYENKIWYSNSKSTAVRHGNNHEFKEKLYWKKNEAYTSKGFAFNKDTAWIVKHNWDIAIQNKRTSHLRTTYFLETGKNLPSRSNAVMIQGNRVLIGTNDGLFVMRRDSIYKFENKDSLLLGRIDHIQENDKGDLYLGTKGMGLVICTTNAEVYNIATDDGLLSDYIESITIDENGIIWISSLKGINRIKINNKGDYNIQSITMDHGLPVPDVYDLEWYDGKLYAATGKGVVEIDPFGIDVTSPVPLLETFEVNQNDYSQENLLSLPYDKNNINLSFKTIDHNQPNKISYRYKLNDGKWNQSKERSVSFIDLPPSNYDFYVQSKNKDGLWSKSRIVQFNIKTPWWTQKWIYILGGAGLIIGLVFYFRKREKSILKKNETEKEIQQLKKAALQSQMNPHFIFNSLNSIQNFIMGNNKLEAMDYLGRFAKLIRLTLNASSQEKITLYEEIQMLEHYLSLEKLRFKSIFDYTFNIGNDVDIHHTYIPPMLIQPLVENAIKHGMKDMEENGQVEVHIKKKDDRLHILIRDNGLNTNHPTNRPTITYNNKNKHKSLGMRITGKRLNIDDGIELRRVDGWTEVEIWV